MTVHQGERWVQRMVGYALGAVALMPPTFGLAQMTVPGQFAVSPSGAATYSIPIQVPPGVAGMEPKLALVYNSQAGNGLLGVGWSLSGLSSITRCPRTMAQDGARGSVNYDNNDRYCLDGQRLIAVSGTDGANGTEYRTEQDAYSKVTSYSEMGSTNGPGSFIVKTKSGLTMEFGKTEDSRIEAQGRIDSNGHGVVMTWALNKVTDVKGNYYSVSYAEDNARGEYRPDRIVLGSISFAFDYQARPDVMKWYVATSATGYSQRMTGLRINNGSGDVVQYKIGYGTSHASGWSVLNSLYKCAPACLPQVTFTYTDSQVNATAWSVSANGEGDSGWDVGDIFGDGREVYWSHSSNGYHYATRLNEDGTAQNWTWVNGPGVGNGGWRLIDLFGDGRKVYWTRNNSTHYAARFGADGSIENWTWQAQGAGDQGWDFGDLFGDGHQVYWTHSNNGTHYASRFNSDGTVTNWTWSGGQGVGNGGSRLVDLFGDGRQIYWTRNNNTHSASRLNSDGTVENWTWQAQGAGDQGWDFGDLFGDGHPAYWTHSNNGTHYASRFNSDGTVTNWTWSGGQGVGNGGWRLANLFGDGRKVYWTRNNSTHYASRLNADGTVENWVWAGQGQGDSGWDLANLFGDGRDVYWTFSNSGQHYISRMYPDGSIENIQYSGRGLGSAGYRLADLFGTGRKVYWTRSGTTHYVTAPTVGEPSLLKSVSDGLVLSASMTYGRLPHLRTQADVRYQSGSFSYPRVSLAVPLQVVSDIDVANGVSGTRRISYSYASLLSELGVSGRGDLGFQWTQSKDASTGLVSRTCYRQDWPYVGLVDKVMTATSEAGLPACNSIVDLSPLTATGSNLLSLSLNKYTFTATPATGTAITCQDPDTSSPSCASTAVKPLSRYQAYGFQSLTQSRDWDGSTFIALPASRTTVSQDNWGNVTQVKAETLNTDGKTASGYSKTTTNTYMPVDSANWLLGRLQKSQVQAVSP